jgi:hypothetical protein
MPPDQELTYGEAKQFAIDNLLRMAEAQEKGDLDALDVNYDVFDNNLPRNAGSDFARLRITLEFWDGWIDSKNHDWRFYEPIKSSDWPRLARAIAEDLRLDREISNQIVLERFDRARRPQFTLLERIKRRLGLGVR